MCERTMSSVASSAMAPQLPGTHTQLPPTNLRRSCVGLVTPLCLCVRRLHGRLIRCSVA